MEIWEESKELICLGFQQHNYNGQVGAEVAAKIISCVCKEAEVEYFKPASGIINAVLLEELSDTPYPGLPKPVNLARNANRLRQNL